MLGCGRVVRSQYKSVACVSDCWHALKLRVVEGCGGKGYASRGGGRFLAALRNDMGTARNGMGKARSDMGSKWREGYAEWRVGIPLAPLRFAKGGFPSVASPAVSLRSLASPYAEAKGTGARV